MKKGFSLAELLVVLGIIGLLAAIVLPNIATINARSRDSKRIADISQMRLALEHYFNVYDKYPIDIYTDANFSQNGVLTVPTDPRGGNYVYVSFCETLNSQDPTGYHIGSSMEQPNEQLLADHNTYQDSRNKCTASPAPEFPGNVTTGCAGAPGVGCYDFSQ
jgi:type IV pilus assembly protein PilA